MKMSSIKPNQPSSSNPLYDLIPATQRKRVYAIFGLIGLILGAIVVGWTAVKHGDIPDWVTISVVVYNFLGVPFGALAAANTPAAR